MTSLLLYRDNAAKRPKPASASTASEYLNLPEYIRKAKSYPFFEFEAAVKEGERYCDLNTLCASASASARVPLTDKDAENASGFIELCTGSSSNFEKLVKQWEELKGPFCITPDVWISEGGNDNDSVVTLVAEVHSGKGPEGYRSTLNKEVIGLMTQLRMLRYQYDINQVVGFVLPNSSEPFFVTKVTVRFEKLYFYYACERIPSLEGVKASIRAGYQANKDAIGRLGPSLNSGDILAYPIKLTEAELGDLRNAFHLQKGVKMKQLQSWNSFILQGDNGKVYKFCLNKENYTNTALFTFDIKAMQHREQTINRLVLHEQRLSVFNLSIPFLEFPAAIPPLSASEARQCLVALLRSTKEAINQLHSFNFAHLDIRLPNICFKYDSSRQEAFAVLIDFERVKEYLSSEIIPEYDSCLYRPLNWGVSLTLEQCDFMQLGWMAVWILHFDNALDGSDPHELDNAWREGSIPLSTRNDQFIEQLVQHGEFSDQHLRNSEVFGAANGSSLKTVLGIL